MYIVGFSGPPRSGKDSIANALAAHIEDVRKVQPQILALSQPMREVTFALAGLTYDLPTYEAIKDQVNPILGVTIRQAMIDLSENYVKPTYGHDFWARALVAKLWNPVPKILIVTDMGFDAERLYFESLVGKDNCVWPQITRPGFSFAGDSRSYIGEPPQRTIIHNDIEGPRGILESAVRIYGRLVNKYHWEI